MRYRVVTSLALVLVAGLLALAAVVWSGGAGALAAFLASTAAVLWCKARG